MSDKFKFSDNGFSNKFFRASHLRKTSVVFEEERSIFAGFSEIDITPETGMERPGNYYKNFHRSFNDPCKVRAAVIGNSATTVALVSIDALMIPRKLVLNVREKVEKICGIKKEAVMIAATHSHSSGPTGMVQPGQYDHADKFIRELAYNKSSCADNEYLEHVEKSATKAINNAFLSREKSLASIGMGFEDKVVYNRRFKMSNGMTYTNPRQGNPNIIKPAGPIDAQVGVIGIWDDKKKCKGCIINYACHCVASPPGISANWVYYMEQTIRGALGPDCIIIFLPGACGDIIPNNNLSPHLYRSGIEAARYVGGHVGAEAINVLLNHPRSENFMLDYESKLLYLKRRPPGVNRIKRCYEIVQKSPEEVGSTEWIFAKEIVLLDTLIKKEPVVEVEVQAIQVGPAVFVSNPAEYFCQFGLTIKKGSPFNYTFPVTLANGCVGYVPTADAFDTAGGGYETRLTSYSNLEIDAGDKIADASIELIRQMKPEPLPQFEKAAPFSGKPWGYGNVKPELK